MDKIDRKFEGAFPLQKSLPLSFKGEGDTGGEGIYAEINGLATVLKL